jgi:hypothetical protein
MSQEICYWLLCFVPLQTTPTTKIFGFAEFIQALALLVVLYTIVDVRYRFRLAVTPGALYPVTYALILVIGGETLLTELWIAQGWWVPKTVGLTRHIWQVAFGALFIGAFSTWVYYAFIRPPIFSRRNAKRYAISLYRVVLTGNDRELAVIGNELSRSAASLVARSKHLAPRQPGTPGAKAPIAKRRQPRVEDYAHDILLLIGNRKLCRHIVESSPVTALAFFDAMREQGKFDIPLGQFAKNISTEAISNKDSIAYHEGDGFSSGLIGYLRPWSQTIYGNYPMMKVLGERFGSPLDIHYLAQAAWDAEQWQTYSRAALVTFKAYLISTGGRPHSPVINRAFGDLEHAFNDLYKLNGTIEEPHAKDIQARFGVATEFVRKAVRLLDEHTPLPPFEPRRRENNHNYDIYDQIAKLMFEIIFAASSVTGPPDRAWVVHYMAAWGRFFGLETKSPAWRVVQFKLRRLLYDEVARMTDYPNYKGARILGILLNVMGMKADARGNFERGSRPLAKAIYSWARQHYLTLRDTLPDVADAVLIGTITFDAESNRLVKTYIQGLRKEAPRQYLELNTARPVSGAAVQA